MRISLETSVEQSYLEVKQAFDENLFRRLSPPFPPVRIVRFDGCEAGDVVRLELDFLIFKQHWTSQITEAETNEQEFFFVDEGIELPFFLRKWRHKHRVIASGTGCVIRDEILFEAAGGLSYLLLPVLWAQFAARKPIYRKFFRRSAFR